MASGSIDWEDCEKANSFKDMLRNAAKREFIEEWGASNLPQLQGIEMVPIGYFRNVQRNGKPQFVCLCRFNCNISELMADTSEVRWFDRGIDPRNTATNSIFHIQTLEDLKAAVDAVLHNQGEAEDSVPLLGALLCLEHLIEDAPDRVKEILKLSE